MPTEDIYTLLRNFYGLLVNDFQKRDSLPRESTKLNRSLKPLKTFLMIKNT